ncbi:MAG: phosphoribosyltransferase [Flavobacteriaceae bacterium]|jgi:pyrimidine operon attenuation protein/uracil phosphoribosyltransferase|nr:phosphoribosyltransferase [Flavobacteriaceae bacterium]PHX83974.1 MAG: phosphoribosyltransferase [Flavobacteriales bacterium]
MGERTLILDDRRMARTVERMAWQVLERHREGERLVLAGVRNSGYSLAERIQTHLKPHVDAELIEIEVNKRQPTMEGTRASASASSLEGAHVVVVDDVLNSGATLLYALSYFLTASMGRITTVVLVDRNHKRFPVKADIKGISLSTGLHERVEVDWNSPCATYLV